MALDLSLCTNDRIVRHGPRYRLTWESTAPAGTYFQVYVDRVLVRTTTAKQVWLPATGGGLGRIDVGAVGAGESQTDFAASLPALAGSGNRATLTWTGGRYLASPPDFADLAGFAVYGDGGTGTIDYANRLGFVAAFPGGVLDDGFGTGPFGGGGFGLDAKTYTWTSGPLASGTHQFGVKPVGRGGREGLAEVLAVPITAPPPPPQAYPDGTRLTIVHDVVSGPTLTWQASP